MAADLLPGQAPYSSIVEGAEAWGDVRTNRREDAKWRGVARRLLDSVSPRGVGAIYLAAQPSDADGFTLGGVVFEWDNDATVVAGATALTIGASIDADADVLVAALNASAAGVDAVKLVAALEGATTEVVVAVIARGARGDQSNLAFSAVTLTNADSFCQTLQDGDTPAAYREARGIHAINANEVGANSPSADRAEFPVGATNFSEQPDWLMVRCVDTNGDEKSLVGVGFTWTQVNGDHWVLSARDASLAVLAAGDVIHWQACSF